jgi:hypothetical protein
MRKKDRNMNTTKKAAIADSILNENTPNSLSKHKLMRQPGKTS